MPTQAVPGADTATAEAIGEHSQILPNIWIGTVLLPSVTELLMDLLSLPREKHLSLTGVMMPMLELMTIIFSSKPVYGTAQRMILLILPARYLVLGILEVFPRLQKLQLTLPEKMYGLLQ